MPFEPDYRALFRASPYPYMLLDRQLNIIAANDAYLAVTGACERDVVGRPLFEAFPENADDPDSTAVAEVRASVERAIATRKPDPMPFVRYSIRSGENFEERYWSSVHNPVLDEAGEVVFVAQNSLDVTDFYRFDRGSRMLAPDDGPGRCQAACGARARWPAPAAITRRCATAARTTAARCGSRSAARCALTRKGSRLRCAGRRSMSPNAFGTGHPAILGDHKRVVQVLANLLGNASKYTPEGGAIAVALRVRGDSALLEVADTGIGIGPDLLPRVFDLFTQGERSADRAQGGLGVGLAVVRSLVELLGGQVTAASDGAGQGSVFAVTLPLLAAAAPAQGAPAALVQPGCAPRLRLLVVDDNPDAAQTLALLMEAHGFDGVVETSSLAALSRIEAERFDACLLDIGLPELDGYRLARRIRALPRMAGVTLVAITGYGQAGDRARALDAGFDHGCGWTGQAVAALAALIRRSSAGGPRVEGISLLL